ncbi:DMT family transporter [Gramella sp. MAR_2010_147]|uniref:EamA family transporter n=1 Tax=Gramella sp. MAR_2010_147 TaxID=1250205 RepID=UPI000879A63A|nr:DMT family transporter [Gramella sp. MAR_2010_147]SDS66998.1 Threonine/homoserine efflux transporter RhtA [Gramella sp. MAR_2010_147]
MDKSILKGSILVGLGACSYGMLTTFVKMAYADGYTSHEVTFSQMALGVIGLLLINLFVRRKQTDVAEVSRTRSKLKLMAAGTTLGLTSTFYYLAVKYIPVSIGIVMLMQSVWMGVVLEALIQRKKPEAKKNIAVIAILLGTLMATNVLNDSFVIDWRGIGWGFLAAMSYTGTIYCSNTVSLEMHSLKRSLWMMIGGFLIVSAISLPYLVVEYRMEILLNWGLVLALFGTILPPLLYTAGMPKIDVGLGAIISSIELPAAVLMAYFLLNEKVDLAQWLGIVLILLAVVQMNLRKRKSSRVQ